MTKDELSEALAKSNAKNDSLFETLKNLGAELDGARNSVETLKEKLHKSEVELAKLRGYRERVNEDDVVREEVLTPPLDPTRHNGRDGHEPLRPIPKRSLAGPQPVAVDYFDEISTGRDLYGRKQEKPKHWVNL